MKKIVVSLLLGFLVISMNGQHPFQNSKLTVDKRIDDLISQLTLEEKASLLLYNSPAIERLGIPAYNWWNEALHGVARNGRATVFPQAIGLAATFDTALVHRVASAISNEARAKYQASIKKGIYGQYSGLTFWTPNINIFRDPRWGRGQETYGEDPFLTSQIGTAFVKGLQGNHPNYLKTTACAKHYVVHSGPEALRHEFDAVVSDRDFWDTYIPAFKALVEADVQSVMCAYNRTNSGLCCGDPFLLKDVLRDKLGFDGQIVSDCWALSDFVSGHKTVTTEPEAAALAVKAGVNLNCGYIYKSVPEAIKLGLINEKELDGILRPNLRLRFRLGMFDPPENNPWRNISPSVVNCEGHKELARQAAVKSFVLLKNDNQVLPLRKDIGSLFVTGPVASNVEVLLGNYNGLPGEAVTFLEGITSKVDVSTKISYNEGCDLLEFGARKLWFAEWSEATIAFLGITPDLEGEEGDAYLSANKGDRESISLPESQLKFLQELRKRTKEKPLIVVVTGGSTISLTDVFPLADAIIMAWYPGEQGGNAMADVLFGDANFSGRLPLTFYHSEKDLPPFEDYNMEGRTYRYFHGDAMFPFGFGMNYSHFSYNTLGTDKTVYKPGENIELEILIANENETDGDEVIQVYVSKPDSKIVRPIKELKAFKKVFLYAGQSQKVKLSLPVDELEYYDTELKGYTVEPGKYLIQIGKSSDQIEMQGEFSIAI